MLAYLSSFVVPCISITAMAWIAVAILTPAELLEWFSSVVGVGSRTLDVVFLFVTCLVVLYLMARYREPWRNDRDRSTPLWLWPAVAGVSLIMAPVMLIKSFVNGLPMLLSLAALLIYRAAIRTRSRGAWIGFNLASVVCVALILPLPRIFPILGGLDHAVTVYVSSMGAERLQTWATFVMDEPEVYCRYGSDSELDRLKFPREIEGIPALRSVHLVPANAWEEEHLHILSAFSRDDYTSLLVGRPNYEPPLWQREGMVKLADGIWQAR